MSPFGNPRENNFNTKPSEPREDFFEDDGVSDIENDIESHIRDLKKLILLCASMVETLQTEAGIEVYQTIKDLAEKILPKLESVQNSDIDSQYMINMVNTVEDFMVDQDDLIKIFEKVDKYPEEEEVLMCALSLREAYADI